ncbi:MAG: hypothetical protein VX278_02740 [Myxococcota bacterium]|nr:hypothetical protein [Myxococcota bacterium]
MLSIWLSIASALAFQPSDTNWIGIEPTRHYRYHTAVQHRMRQTHSWREFYNTYGWKVVFDEYTGFPHRAYGSGISLSLSDTKESALAAGRSFLKDNPVFVNEKQMRLSKGEAAYNPNLDAWYLSFEQRVSVSMQQDLTGEHIREARVWRGGIQLFVQAGKLSMLQSRLYPFEEIQVGALKASEAVEIANNQGPAPSANHTSIEVEAVILPWSNDNVLENRLCWMVKSKTQDPIGHWVTFVDAQNGSVLNIHNEIRFFDGSIHATHDLRTINGETATSPLKYLKIGETLHSDANGAFSTEEEGLVSELLGIYTTINNSAGENLQIDIVEGETVLASPEEDEEILSQLDQYVFQNHIYEWAEEHAPHVVNAWPRSSINVNINDVCNAYFDGTLNFFRSGEGCNNTGRIADVSYHEWGHGFHYYNLLSGDYDGSMSEGLSDSIAFFQTGDSVMAPGFAQNGYGIREAATNRVYPDDLVYEVHTDGLIFAGTMWDLWPLMEDHYGDPELAYDALVGLFVQALRSGPNLQGSYDAFIFADDDNGDLQDGTTHECEIVEAFGLHGLGPKGEGGFFRLSHLPIANQSAESASYALEADLQLFAENCLDADVGSVLVNYSTDDGVSWSSAELNVSDDGIEGTIPALNEGDVVLYYLELIDTENRSVQLPETGTINPFSFYVGEAEEIFCADFEETDGGFTHALIDGREQEGADDWMWGAPRGYAGDPDYAASGDFVWGNDFGGSINGTDWNGEYQNDKQLRLTSPGMDVSGYDEVILVYQRWLNVEDGYYDQARIYANDEVVWTNHATRYEIGDEHHQDKQWQQHVVKVKAAEIDTMNFSWEIQSDGGLTMGGWNIDDVCVYGIQTVNIESEAVETTGGCACTTVTNPKAPIASLLLIVLGALYRRKE